MADFLNAIAKKHQNSDSTFKVSLLQTHNLGVQKKSPEPAPATKVQLWKNYQTAKQLHHNSANPSLAAPEQTQALPIQAKLTIGKPGDKYEQEADSVAERVMAMSEPSQVQRQELPQQEKELQMKPLAATISPLVQREELPEENDKELQTKPDDNAIQREVAPEEENESAVQMKPVSNSIQREGMPEEEELQTKPDDNAIHREVAPEQEDESAVQMKPVGNSIQREGMPEDEELQTKPDDNAIQREVASEQEDESAVQMKPVGNSIQREELPEEEIQTKQSPTPNSPIPTPSLENRLSNSKGGGSPLPDEVRSFMEPRFGADFSGVRVHTGSDAVQMNRDVNAQAFAHGRDVYFGAGKAPANDSLTAHELTHVVQQTGASKLLPKRTQLVSRGTEQIQRRRRWSVKKAFKSVVKQVKTKAKAVGSNIKKGAKTFGSKLKKGAKTGWSKVKKGAKTLAKKVGGIFGPILDLQKILVKVLLGAGSAIPKVLKNPVAFVKSLFSGLGQGFKSFASQIQKHLQSGLQTFLFGSLGNLSLKLPQSFNAEGLLGLSAQLTGLSHDKIRAKAVGKLGEDKVKLIEQGASAVKTGNAAGFAKQQAASKLSPEKQHQIQEASQMFKALRGGAKGMLQYFSNLNIGEISKLVIDSLKTYLTEQVMLKGVTKIVASLTPGAGWVLAAIDALRMMYGLFIERAQQLKDLSTGASQSIVEASQHNIGGVAQKMESSLAKAVPMLISILGDYVGVGDISKKVKQFLDRGGDWVNKNIMPVIDRVLNGVAGLF
jgi:Domain of unknown function (DUF4157)